MGTLKVDTIQDSGGNTILSSDGSGGFSNSLPAGKTSSYRNLIINGDMSIAQRSTSATSVSSSGYHALDRFRFGFTDTDQLVATISQDTDVPTGQGFTNSMKFLVTTVETALDADDALQIQYRMEGQNLQYLKFGTSSAESLTLSFWVKSSVTGTYALSFKNSDDGGTQLNVNTYSISSANTWEKKTITISGDTSTNIDNTNGNKLEVLWGLSAGSNYTGTSSSGWTSYGASKLFNGQTADIATSSGATFYLTGVQLEVGTTASDFEFIPYDVNFERCARYYYEWGGLDNYETAFVGTWTSSSACYMKLEHYKEMRSTPSFSKTGNWSILGPGGTLGTTANTGHATRRAIQIEWASGSGGTQGRAGLVRATNDSSARLKVDAEL